MTQAAIRYDQQAFTARSSTRSQSGPRSVQEAPGEVRERPNRSHCKSENAPSPGTSYREDPNMKVEILAIPPRKDPGDVCCKWRFSMRTEDDPEYVPIELSTKTPDQDARPLN